MTAGLTCENKWINYLRDDDAERLCSQIFFVHQMPASNQRIQSNQAYETKTDAILLARPVRKTSYIHCPLLLCNSLLAAFCSFRCAVVFSLLLVLPTRQHLPPPFQHAFQIFVYRERDSLAGSHTHNTRRNALIERPTAFLFPHIPF